MGGVYRAVVASGDGRSVVEARVAAVIDSVEQRGGELIGRIQRHLAAEIAELGGDAQLLELMGASVAGNVETVFDALRYGIGIERIEPPTAALEYARRVAQHGIPVTALVRAYRLGQQQMLMDVLDEVRRADLAPDQALDVFDVISSVTFRYIDWISEQVIQAYETERERWLENRNSVRAVRVRELVETPADQLEHLDVDAAGTAIRYPLRRSHLAVILWVAAGEEASGRELLRLERFLCELGDSLGLRDGPLFVAADRVSGWGWLPLTEGAHADPVERIRQVVAGSEDPPYLAVGTELPGALGFRRSHMQARTARRVAIVGARGRRGRPRVTAAGDPGVSAAALLAENLAATREWVGETLGPLAADTESDGRLRETLRVFLREGASYKAAADVLNLHFNSVRYRVQRAFERRGRPIGADRIDVELALLACDQFGAEVLRTAGPSATT